MKILLATDGSPCSDHVIEAVINRPWPEGSEVRVVTIDAPSNSNQTREGSASAFDTIVQQERAAAENRLKCALDIIRTRAPHLGVSSGLLEGRPADVIVQEAERWGADLILVGSHGYGPVKRFFLGSVSLAVATNAHCSVEIIRVS